MQTNKTEDFKNRLKNAEIEILADIKIWKRLRYCQALKKIGKLPSERQVFLLSTEIIPYLDKQMITIDEMEVYEDIIQQFQLSLMAKAWNQGSMTSNFKLLKLAIDNTK